MLLLITLWYVQTLLITLLTTVYAQCTGLLKKKFIIMQGIVRRKKKSCAATGCIFVCSMIHGLCRGEKMGGCVWLHISNTFFHHHHHQQPLARFVNHCAVKLFVKSNLIPFYVCLIWGLSTLAVLYNLEQKSSLHLYSKRLHSG